MEHHNYKTAFTLAEVLITLGIIGVVAALTMPAIIANYQKKQTVVKLKKVYSQLMEAVKFSEIENGDAYTWDFKLPARDFADKYLSSYLKIDNSRGASDINKNLHYKYIDGSEYKNSVLTADNSAVLILGDGTFVFVDEWRPANYSFIAIYIDINGNKGPNTVGKDVFRFEINNEDNPQKLFRNSNSNTDCESKGDGCAQKIIEDGWQILSDYPW